MSDFLRDNAYSAHDVTDKIREHIEKLNDIEADLEAKGNQIGNLTGIVKSIDEFPIQTPETNDTGRFQRAFDFLETKGGGIIHLSLGTFTANAKVPSNCGIIGAGRKSIIKVPNNSTSAAVELKDGNVRNIFLYNFSIDGNKANQTSSNARGIYINGNASITASSNPVETNDPRHTIQHVFIANTKGVGFEIHGRGENQIDDVQVMLSDDVGMILDAFDTWYTNLSSGANKKTGIIVSQNNCRLINCKSWNNGQGGTAGDTETYGFKIYNAGIVEGVVLTGCEAQANYNHGFAFINARACTGSALNSELNGQNGANGIAGGSGFYFKDSRENNIHGVCRNMNVLVQEYAVTIDGFSVSNTVDVTSWLMKTGAVNDLSSNKDNNRLTILDVGNGEVKRYYRNGGVDLLRVNNSSQSFATSPFGVFSKEGANQMGAFIQKEVDTLTSMQELMRFEAYKTGDYNTKSRVQIYTQVDNGDVNIANTGRLKNNSLPLSRFVSVPASATATGSQGDWSADASYLYICHATNTWKRVAIATW